MFAANLLKALTKPLSVRHYNVDLVSFVAVRLVVADSAVFVVVVFKFLACWGPTWDNYIFEGPLICPSPSVGSCEIKQIVL